VPAPAARAARVAPLPGASRLPTWRLVVEHPSPSDTLSGGPPHMAAQAAHRPHCLPPPRFADSVAFVSIVLPAMVSSPAFQVSNLAATASTKGCSTSRLSRLMDSETIWHGKALCTTAMSSSEHLFAFHT